MLQLKQAQKITDKTKYIKEKFVSNLSRTPPPWNPILHSWMSSLWLERWSTCSKQCLPNKSYLLNEELGICLSDSVPWKLHLNESIYVLYGQDDPELCRGLDAVNNKLLRWNLFNSLFQFSSRYSIKEALKKTC